MIGRLGPFGQPDRGRPDRLGHVGEHPRQLVVALDGDGRPMERGDRALSVGEGDERMEGPDLGAGGHRRSEDLGAERAAGMDHGLPAVHPERGGEGHDGVVGDGQD
ncbi:MAG TPA: hypothetical protein VIM25_03920, partial [Candidatus Limnocylindrales bacterium]